MRIVARISILIAIFVGSVWPPSLVFAVEPQEQIFRVEVREVGSPIVIQSANSFLLDSDGYLLTSLTAIGLAVVNPALYEIVIFVHDTPLIGQIENLDLESGLAVIRVPKTFTTPVSLAASIGGGNFLGSFIGYSESQKIVQQSVSWLGKREISYLPRYAFSGEWREGLDGSPIFNSNGELISVGLGLTSKERAIQGATLDSIRSLQQKIKSTRQLANSKSWSKELSQQVKSAESHFDARKSLADEVPLKKLDGVSFMPLGTAAKCRSDLIFGKGRKGKYLHCQEQVRIGNDDTTAIMKTNLFAISDSVLTADVEDFPRVDIFLRDKEGRSISSIESSFCSIRNLQNGKKVKMIVRICSKDDATLPGLSSTYVKLNLLDGSYQEFLFQMYFSGMSFDFTMDRLSEFLESINLEKR
jgi:hypothetical protein